MSARDALRADRQAIDGLATCPDCGDICPTGATVCEGCGSRLFVGPPRGRPFEPKQLPLQVRGCTCNGEGLCIACRLHHYDHGIAA